jgi:pimeloyl-ACP methyl ester carboxylesterase
MIYVGTLVTTVVLWTQSRRTSEIVLRRTYQVFAALGTLVLVFQHTTISGWLWTLLNFQKLLQFSWRWNVPGLVVVASAVALMRHGSARRWMNLVVVLWSLSAIVLATLTDFNLRVHPRAPRRSPYDPPEYAPAATFSSPDSVIRFASAHASDPFVTTRSARPFRAVAVRGDRNVKLHIDATDTTEVSFHQWYWPTWVLYGPDDRVVPTFPDSTGRAAARLPAGSYDLTYRLELSSAEKSGRWVSVVSLLALLASSGYLYKRRGASSDPKSQELQEDVGMTFTSH